MKTQLSYKKAWLSGRKVVWYHFYPGILLLIFYVIVCPLIIARGYPGIMALLLAEVMVLAPIAWVHLRRVRQTLDSQPLIPYTNTLTLRQYIIWGGLGILGCILVYVPMYPVGIWLRETVFSWLPAWFFNPLAGNANQQVLSGVMLAGILIDGVIGPVAEELYFRGYLLPRMAFLKNWAPVVNGLFFGLYHFWQPHNYAAIVAVGIIISTIVWKKKNVYLGIIIHCAINIMGAIGGYMAVISGEGFVR